MAVPQNFRSAFNGFNREDVVNYISYITTKHDTEVNELRSEIDTLSKDLESVRAESESREDLEQENAEQKAQIETLQQENEAQKELIAQLQEQLESQKGQLAQKQPDAPAAAGKKPGQVPSWNEELNAYRRAESTERRARERVGRMYDKANGVLADASTKIGSSAEDLGALAEEVQKNLDFFRQALDGSCQVLAEAAVSLGTIRPEKE